MQETERRAIGLGQRRPVGSRFFEQAECTVDVGADEIIGAVDGAVDVALSGEVNDGAGPLALEQVAQKIAIDDVAVCEAIARVSFDGAQVVEIARVRQLVEIQDARAFRGNPLENEIRANEASATGDENEIFHAGNADIVPRRRVPILIIITAGREVVRTFGGRVRSGGYGLPGPGDRGSAQRRYRDCKSADWVCSL